MNLPALPIAVLVLALGTGITLPAQTLAQWTDQPKALKESGDADAALQAFQKAAQLNPKSAFLQDEIGFLLAVLSRHDEAMSHFQRAIGLDAAYAPAHYHLGVAQWLKRDPDHAIASLRQAAKLDPKNVEYRYRLGSMLY